MLRLDDIRRRYDVVEATYEHAAAMAPIMRPSDRDEVKATSGLNPRDGLLASLASSLYAWTWRVDGVPACMFGIGSGSILSGEGMPWLLTSNVLDQHWRPFVKHYRPFLDQMKADFPVLANWVDARHETAIRWLKWMGFEIGPIVPHGPRGLPHRRFEWRRHPLLVEVRKVSIADVAGNRNFPALAAEYAAECAIHGLPAPVEKITAYAAIEQSGAFQGYGAFKGDMLIGFVAVLTPIIPHYGVSIAVTESMFVGRAYRKGGAGIKLLRAAERHAREAGAPGIMVSAPTGGPLAEVLQRVGYRETNRVFFKEMAVA